MKLLDINPWSLQTDPLLFTWNELLDIENGPIFHIVESQDGVLNSIAPLYSSSRLPKDIIDLSNGSSIEDFSRKFQQELELERFY